MEVAVDEPGYDGHPASIEYFRPFAVQASNEVIRTNCDDPAIANRESLSRRRCWLHRINARVSHDEVGASSVGQCKQLPWAADSPDRCQGLAKQAPAANRRHCSSFEDSPIASASFST